MGIKALVAASTEDTATGGPDLTRGILPNVVRIDAAGVLEVPDETILPHAEEAVESVR